MSAAKEKCPAFWQDDQGRCSDDDSGAGRHTCNMADDHTKCRCRCGSTHPRPVDHVRRYVERIGRASISVDEKGAGRVMAGLTDLSSQVTAGTVRFRNGHPTIIEVEMPMAVAVARGEIELDEETGTALRAAGWKSPQFELEVRRDLQDALGGLGSVVLREWGDLLGWVRKLVEFNEQLLHEREALAVLLDLQSGATRESIEAKVRELQAKAGEQP